MFRMASLLLEGGGETPGLWRELGAAVLSPGLGFNRLVFGERFKPVFPSRDHRRVHPPAAGRHPHHERDQREPVARRPGAGWQLDFYMTYGLPGKPGYKYTRPFDFFLFEFTAVPNARTAADAIENVTIRGLLVGERYELGDDYRGALGPLRRLRVPVAADLPRGDDELRDRHRGPVVADAHGGPAGHGPRRPRVRRGRHRRAIGPSATTAMA